MLEALNFKRGSLLLLIPINMLMGIICFWQGDPDDFLMRGARGLLDPLIGWPIFIFTLIYTAILCVKKNYNVGMLYFGCGVFLTIGVALLLYVENGGGLIFFMLGNLLRIEVIQCRNGNRA